MYQPRSKLATKTCTVKVMVAGKGISRTTGVCWTIGFSKGDASARRTLERDALSKTYPEPCHALTPIFYEKMTFYAL